jgi:hypothetical protein
MIDRDQNAGACAMNLCAKRGHLRTAFIVAREQNHATGEWMM